MTNNMSKVVCTKCLPDLASFIEGHAADATCSYCETRGSCTAVEVVAERIQECLGDEYDEAANHLPYCGAEGGYQGTTWDTIDLLRDEVNLEVGPDCDDDGLVVDLSRHIKDYTWCERDWARLPPKDRLMHGWRDFKEVIKHKRRYTFWSATKKEDPYDQDEVPAGRMFHEIDEVLASVSIVRAVPVHTEIWRVQVHDASKALTAASDFASPPEQKALHANRMSPAGVSMFYGAESLNVAKSETQTHEPQKVRTAARFWTAMPLQVLDLASLPTIPNFFERERRVERHALMFLHAFASEVSRPVDKQNGCSEVEYAATQAFSEYVRWNMRATDGTRVDGIRYLSATGNGVSYVLFCGHEQCIHQDPHRDHRRWLDFDKTSIAKI